jgi:hypothetical protein
MAVDIRISPTAFNYADAWVKGVTAGQNQAKLDLDWAKWIDAVETRDANQAKVDAAVAKATAERDKGVATAATEADAKEAAGAASLVGSQKERANYIMSRFRTEHGLSPEAAAAMTGNWIQESQLNTTARNKGDGKDGTDSIGLGQWNSGRAVQLKAFAARNNKPWTDLNTQIDFAAWELNNTHKSVGDALRNPSLSVTQASDIVHRRYEVAEMGSAGKRRSNSASVLAGYDPSAPSARELQVRQPDGQMAVYSQGYRTGAEQQGPAAPGAGGTSARVRVQSQFGQQPITGPLTGQQPAAAPAPAVVPVAPLDMRPGATLGLPSLGAPLAPNQQDFFTNPNGQLFGPIPLPGSGRRRQTSELEPDVFNPGFISPQDVANNEQQFFDPNQFFPGVG